MPTLFTGQGDEGYTGLLGEGRVAKYDLRMEAIGAIDEATAALGLARTHASLPDTIETALHVQRDLYLLMAEAAAVPENAARFHAIDESKVAWLEQQIEALGQQVQLPKEFILPGDSTPGAFLDLARTIVRRAERRLAELLHRGDVQNLQLLRYLNRLSSLCFMLELRENQASGVDQSTRAKKTTE